MFRFYIALWASKLMMGFYYLIKKPKTDMPGLLACKMCPDFLEKISKPKLTITVTGTNGKTTTSTLLNDFLKSNGMTTSFNDWGANMMAGYAVNLIRGVSLFNKPKVDCSILEADELTLDTWMAKIKPDYLLVTNICKDSLRRNGHPENIFNHIEHTLRILGDKTTAVLNADDPISSELGKDSRRVYFGMSDTMSNPFVNISKDIAICPRCGGQIKYDYRHYRHIGKFKCASCDFKTPQADYMAEFVDLKNRTMMVNGHEYPLISDTIFNAFNVLSCIAMLKELGYRDGEISGFLSTQKVTDIRETCVEYNGIEYYTFAAKSQNVSAASTVFEYMAKEPSIKDVVLLMDEVQDKNHPTETLTWLYETDYEFLKDPKIRRIIVGGHMYLNHRLRLLLAGVPEERIFAVEDEADIPQCVEQEGIDKVYVLYETDCVSKAKNMRDSIVNYVKEGK
jgi:UDP-N-acetylmuramoylalanine-D-glutamate ligase